MKKAGFSIIEIIVVIVVIAILMTIAVVGYSWMRRDALDAKLEVTAQNVIKKIQAEYVKNKGRDFLVDRYDQTYNETVRYQNRDERPVKTRIKDAFSLNELSDDELAVCAHAIAGNPYDFRVDSYVEDGPDNCDEPSARSKVQLYINFCESRTGGELPRDAQHACITVIRWSHAKGRYIVTKLNSDNTVRQYEYEEDPEEEEQ